MYLSNFIRTEKKYIMTEEKCTSLMSIISHRLTEDMHGRSTICSAYLDTPDFYLVRTSIDAETYKEKLRLRSYGTPTGESTVFLEIKKKYKGVVYKRREAMMLSEAEAFVSDGVKPFDSQIISELDYALNRYGHPKPMCLIAYERNAYFDKAFPSLRITFDRNVRYRMDNIKLSDGSFGKRIIPHDAVLMEIKTDGAMPLWLSSALDICRVFPSSFSKYCTAYKDYIEDQITKPKQGVKKLCMNYLAASQKAI